MSDSKFIKIFLVVIGFALGLYGLNVYLTEDRFEIDQDVVVDGRYEVVDSVKLAKFNEKVDALKQHQKKIKDAEKRGDSEELESLHTWDFVYERVIKLDTTKTLRDTTIRTTIWDRVSREIVYDHQAKHGPGVVCYERTIAEDFIRTQKKKLDKLEKIVEEIENCEN